MEGKGPRATIRKNHVCKKILKVTRKTINILLFSRSASRPVLVEASFVSKVQWHVFGFLNCLQIMPILMLFQTVFGPGIYLPNSERQNATYVWDKPFIITYIQWNDKLGLALLFSLATDQRRTAKKGWHFAQDASSVPFQNNATSTLAPTAVLYPITHLRHANLETTEPSNPSELSTHWLSLVAHFGVGHAMTMLSQQKHEFSTWRKAFWILHLGSDPFHVSLQKYKFHRSPHLSTRKSAQGHNLPLKSPKKSKILRIRLKTKRLITAKSRQCSGANSFYQSRQHHSHCRDRCPEQKMGVSKNRGKPPKMDGL